MQHTLDIDNNMQATILLSPFLAILSRVMCTIEYIFLNSELQYNYLATYLHRIYHSVLICLKKDEIHQNITKWSLISSKVAEES